MLPKAVQMESVGTSNLRHGFDAPAPHIVVACPSCKTSFAVETAAVAALESPRFHCSRCDDIFVMRDTHSDTLPMGGIQVQSLTKSSNGVRPIQPRMRGLPRESLIKPSDFSLGSTPASTSPLVEPTPSPAFEPPPSNRSGLSMLSKGWVESVETSLPQQQDEFYAPSRFTLSASEAAPASTQKTTAPNAGSLPRQFILSDEAPALPAPKLKQSAKLTQPINSTQPINPTHPTNPTQPTKAAPVKSTEVYRPAPPRRQETLVQDERSNTKQLSTRLQSLISMSIPILGALVALLALSYCARLSPQSIDALANIALPSFAKASVQQLPPSALAIKGLELSFQKTRNKETVAVVRGSVLNESGRKFDGVEIEALGFNERGEIILRSRSPLRSALVNEKIAEIPITAVARFQSSLAAKDSAITPREKVPFTIALIHGRDNDGQGEASYNEIDASKIRYFSARIFSVAQGR